MTQLYKAPTDQHGTVKVLLNFFQSKHNACQRRVKSSGQTRAGTADFHDPFFCLALSCDLCKSFGGHSAQLDRGALASKGQTAEDRESAACDLCDQYADPVLTYVSFHLPLYLGDTASGAHFIPFDQSSYDQTQDNQNGKPACNIEGVSLCKVYDAE